MHKLAEKSRQLKARMDQLYDANDLMAALQSIAQ
jgi:hypothetical protein